MRKIVSVVLLFAVLMGLIGVALPTTAEAASVRNRKIVSVVYDDSGSMEGEKWEYTSYAMQCFAAMLNKEDRLDITYMSTYAQGSFSVDTNKRAESVKKIRDHRNSGGTPVEAVNTAFNTLKGVSDSNPNTQYWLVVMTDGQMNGAEKAVNKIADTTMPNGTKPHIVYLTLCDVGGSFTPNFNKSNIVNRSAKTADEIIGVISDIACNISGRYPVDPADIKVVNDTTVEVTSDLPLINIGILSQRSKAQVVSVTDKEGNGFKNEGNVPVAAPGRFPDALPADEKVALNGNVALFSAASGNIPAGTYTITFSESVKKEDLVVMFEPAFELRMEMTIGGVPVTDPSQLVEGAVVDVEATLYEIGTDSKIALSMLPDGYKTSISCAENGKIVADESSLKMTGIQLKPVETEITATLEVPGFFTAIDLMRFTPMPIVLSGMTADIHYDGSERMKDENGNPDPDNVVYIDRMKTDETGVVFALEIEGSPISRDKALAIQALFEERLETELPSYEVTVGNDGRLFVTPKENFWKWVIGDLIYFWLYGGQKQVSCTYDGITASETLELKLADEWAAWGQFGVRLLILTGFLYLLFWLFVKPHFMKPAKVRLYCDRGAGYQLVAGSTKRVHYLAASDPLNFFGPFGMRRRLGRTGFYVRSTRADGYRVEGVKGKRVSEGNRYPNGAPHEERYADFTDKIYIADAGGTYYMVSVE